MIIDLTCRAASTLRVRSEQLFVGQEPQRVRAALWVYRPLACSLAATVTSVPYSSP